jgi:3-oxoacyl-[acyl-carrier-protein] synthase III
LARRASCLPRDKRPDIPSITCGLRVGTWVGQGAASKANAAIEVACSGFLYALAIASQFVLTGDARKIVVVGADKTSALVDYADRSTCVLFGDGAGAIMVEQVSGCHGI